MKKATYLLLAICLLPGLTNSSWLQAAPIYTWEDDRGVTHFSDRPDPNANIIELTAPLATEFQSNTASAPADMQDNQPGPSISIRLLSPHDQQTLRDNQGIIDIAATTSHKLAPHHTVQLLLDGESSGPPQSRLNWHLSNIDRGSHTLQVQILNSGKVIALSEVITVYLHRASRLQPQSPAVTPK
ncbi:DUF4124 domain-containing protein [Photobacterium sp. OFAV2-7]|uniref:DUF4124 domain-containing protein n=1 Tax=Photobacterium sp. OFAV2-7 TaxID=2917748 RepID=UPI001EF709B3|nr:DUF4124 domain-containing protein [Photobacterium sp. OFAV2-7]MCG7584362.1 DUF4124 domain-containing protein [Photobacterium sp. OFAV2-7]